MHLHEYSASSDDCVHKENIFLQVSPSELESILVMHPDIQDAAVVGIEDEMFGELPTAFIVREPDVYVTEDQIKDYVARK